MTAEDLISSRINPNLPTAELNQALEAVSLAFDRKWLEHGTSHPVQELWARRDFLATVELFWLGDSLQRLVPLNERWVRHVIEQMKDSNRNSRVGHAFELLLGAALTVPGQAVTLAAPGTPNYDMDVNVHDGPHLRMSLKNFGASPRQSAFEARCQELQDRLLDAVSRLGVQWFGAFIECDHYPLDSEWALLYEDLPNRLEQQYPQQIGPWTVIAIPQAPASHGLEASRVSYNFVVAVPYHTNERKNFLDRIERECLKFNKATKKFSAGFAAVVLFRIAETAPFSDYVDWAREYVARKDTDIKMLNFYQSAVTQGLDDSTALNHHMSAAGEALPGKLPNFSFIVGRISASPAHDELRMNGQTLSLAGKHWYQRSELFDVQPGALDGATILMSQQPGKTRHGVIELPEGATIILSPRHKAYDHITLFK
jgi:hypothetical protein